MRQSLILCLVLSACAAVSSVIERCKNYLDDGCVDPVRVGNKFLYGLPKEPVRVINPERFKKIMEEMSTEVLMVILLQNQKATDPFGLGDLQRLSAIIGNVIPMVVQAPGPLSFHRKHIIPMNQTLTLIMTNETAVKISALPAFRGKTVTAEILRGWLSNRVKARAHIRSLEIGGVEIFNKDTSDARLSSEIERMLAALEASRSNALPQARTPHGGKKSPGIAKPVIPTPLPAVTNSTPHSAPAESPLNTEQTASTPSLVVFITFIFGLLGRAIATLFH